jgi:hypothetical protein
MPMLILTAAVILLQFSPPPAPAAAAARDSRLSGDQWRHNPFIPLLKPRAAEVREGKGGQAAPYEDFSLPPDLKLKAVIKCSGRYKAIVGNQLVVPDDQVMGFIVAEVHPDRVVLLKNGRVVELSLHSKVDRKRNFSINSVGGESRNREQDAAPAAAGGKKGKSFIRLVTAAGKPEASPAGKTTENNRQD